MAQRVELIGVGANSNIEHQVDASFQAGRTSLRPLEFVGSGFIGGHYVLAATFSNTAGQPAASSQLFSWRWSDTRILCVLSRVAISAGISTVFTGAQLLDYDMILARSFTSNPTGGTSITPATTAQKMRTATMSGSLFSASGSIMISSGTALTAGSQTLDTQPVGYVVGMQQFGAGSTATVVPSTPLQSLFEVRDFGHHQIVLGNNEGFVIRNQTAYGAGGVVKHGIVIEWAEVPAF